MEELMYTCERCGFQTTLKGSLVRHLQNKKVCPAKVKNIGRQELLSRLVTREYKTETTICEFCNKTISKPVIARHKKTCKQREQPTLKVTEYDGISEETLQKLKQIIKQEVLEEIEHSKTSVVNNINHNTTINNNTFNIQLNSFGNENMSYLTPEFLTYCLRNPKKGLSSLIEMIHYNKDYPENHNLRCKSLKNNVFERFVDTHWTLCDASNTLDELIRKGYRILESHISQQSSNDPDFYDDENTVYAIQRFRVVLTDKQSQDYYSVKRDLRLLVKDKTMYLLELVEPVEQTTE
jgi:hypothetical protein